MNKFFVPWAATALVIGGCISAGFAHHSLGAFDSTTEMTVRGEVIQFEWTNPHAWVWIRVENPDGTQTRWGLEGMSPNYLGRRGWDKNSLKPGDSVQVLIFPLKNGEPGGTFLRVTFEDGTEKIMWNRRAAPQ